MRRTPDAEVGCRKNCDVMIPLKPEYTGWLKRFWTFTDRFSR
jgi:hypothetical protein